MKTVIVLMALALLAGEASAKCKVNWTGGACGVAPKGDATKRESPNYDHGPYSHQPPSHPK